MTNPAMEVAPSETPSPSLQARVESLFEPKKPTNEPPAPAPEAQPEETLEAEETETSEAEATQETETNAELTPEEFTIRWNGEERKLSKAELIEQAQKGFDYTQKTQEVAEQRKAHEAERQAFEQQRALQQQYIEQVGKISAIDLQLAQFENQYKNADWGKLSSDDPFEYTKLTNYYRDLREARQQLSSQLEAQVAKDSEEKQRTRAKRISETLETIKRDIKGWNDDTRNKLDGYLRNVGYKADELSDLADARVIKMAHKAMLFDQLQQSKASAEKKVVEVPKVVKPGTSANKLTETQQLQRQLRSTKNEQSKAKIVQKLLEKRF